MINPWVHKFYSLVFFTVILVGCSSSGATPPKGEYIFRRYGEKFAQVEKMTPQSLPTYPWEEENLTHIPKLTKDFFRCNGCSLNPPHLIKKEKEIVRFYDCGGPQRHSLPLRDDKEFIYPILLDLLNYIQNKTGKRVVITCGHCCPDHHLYLDPHASNQTSKHMVGAEVDFYVQGMENQPEKIIQLLMGYYKENSKYQGNKEFEEFKRYDKSDSQVTTQPWFNKEIFIKLFKKQEGRDGDNRHPYPYLSLQVRYDTERKEKVNYSWDKAYRNLHRW